MAGLVWSPPPDIISNSFDLTFTESGLFGAIAESTITDPQVVDYRAGQRIRLRIINAGADTAFRVGVPGVALRVTHTDGFPVVPQRADSVILGMGERADAVVELRSSVPVATKRLLSGAQDTR